MPQAAALTILKRLIIRSLQIKRANVGALRTSSMTSLATEENPA